MTADEASRILEISPGSSPQEIEARFDERRAQLETKIGKAPTPGLKEKYRRSLEEVTLAYETLTFAADASVLPVVEREAQVAPVARQSASPVQVPADHPIREPVSGARPPQKNRRGGFEFLVVALIAVGALSGGAWWLAETRKADAERARMEAAAQADAARQAALLQQKAEEEKARQDALNAILRAQLAESRIRWESLEREAQGAERLLSELRSDLRSARDIPPESRAALEAQQNAQQSYVEWLQGSLLRHPARSHIARLDALLAAGAVDEAALSASDLAESLSRAEAEIPVQKRNLLALTAGLRIESVPLGLSYELEDSYGRTHAGKTPAELDVPLGAATVTLSRAAGWEPQVKKVFIRRGETSNVVADFPSGGLFIDSDPAGLPYQVRNEAGLSYRGTTPATHSELPVGPVEVSISREEWPEYHETVEVETAQTRTVRSEFAPGDLIVETDPPEATVWINDEEAGLTPLTVTLPPGEKHVRIELWGYQAMRGPVTIEPKGSEKIALTLKKLGPQGGQRWTIPDLGLEVIPVPAGKFLMGSPSNELARDGDERQHEVILTKSFWLGKTEVTQKQWEMVMGMNPSKYVHPDHPVEQVSWHQAVEFCRKLTERERAAGRLSARQSYTLPTEAQWEYVCRAGTTAPYAGDPHAMGWYNANSGGQPRPVAQKAPNAWGFHDMHGNVYEWCLDWYFKKYPGKVATDPVGPANGQHRILRGGSYYNQSDFMRSARRIGYIPTYIATNFGFRVAVVETTETPAPRERLF